MRSWKMHILKMTRRKYTLSARIVYGNALVVIFVC